MMSSVMICLKYEWLKLKLMMIIIICHAEMGAEQGLLVYLAAAEHYVYFYSKKGVECNH